MSNKNIKKDKKKFPHVYVVLITIIVICAILTYIVPAGEFARIEVKDKGTVVDPETFKYISQKPVNLFGVLKSIPEGLVQTAEIIFFIFIVGGSFGILQYTGAIDAGIGKVTTMLKGREKFIIPVIMFLFSLCGAIFGMAEETLPFIPIMVTLAIALGYDSLTGAGMVLIGAGAGFAGAFMNPFTIGVAQGIAELPMFSGMEFRIVLYLTMTIISIIFVYRYAEKIKKKPESSIVYEIDQKREEILDVNQIRTMTKKDSLVLLILLATVITLVVGVINFAWSIPEISALFLGMSMVVAFVARIGFNTYGEQLVEGMAGMAGGALVVGFARAILVVLTDGAIIDTILNFSASTVSQLPSVFTAVGMYVFQALLNFIIPSGSGQAAVSIPIMAPLADLTDVTRQTAVVAFQLGDGISNILTPTSGFFMAALALAKIPWEKWVKWFFKLVLIQYAIGGIFVIIAHLINLGPS